MKTHYFLSALAVTLLTGCGMAETTAVTAAQAESAAKQLQEAERIKAKVEQDLAAAQAATSQRMETAERE